MCQVQVHYSHSRIYALDWPVHYSGNKQPMRVSFIGPGRGLCKQTFGEMASPVSAFTKPHMSSNWHRTATPLFRFLRRFIGIANESRSWVVVEAAPLPPGADEHIRVKVITLEGPSTFFGCAPAGHHQAFRFYRCLRRFRWRNAV